VRIVEELVKIWLNKVCDKSIAVRTDNCQHMQVEIVNIVL